MTPDKEKFRTERSRAGFLHLAFKAGATGHPAAARLAPRDRRPPSMHDTPASCFTAPPIRADGQLRLEIIRARRETALPAGVTAAEK